MKVFSKMKKGNLKMAVKLTRRTKYSFRVLNLAMLSILCTEAGYAYQPASASACVALESNAERLNCYDGLFSVKLSDVTVASVLVAEGAGSAEAMPLQTLKRPSSRDNKQGNPNHFFALEHHQSDLKASLIDQRWELTPEQKLGTWNLRAYQPIYLLPALWTSEKNEVPHTPNKTLAEQQNLNSMEAKLQLSLKTKALENLFEDNGDMWVGYTQTAHWQVYNEDESRPFRETNYEPEASLIFRAGYAYQPASASACVALESNAERLNCYDGLFSVKLSDVTVASVLVAEGAGSAEAMPLQTLKRPSSRDNKQGNPNHFFALEHHQSDLKASLIDQRWELTPEQKLGTWNLRAYQPIYLLPALWTSEKNEVPHTPNKTLAEQQNLNSMEAKLQLSLKTKALENLFEDNGDMWVGYTQTAHWQVYNEDESRPFRETNYEPEASLIFRTDYSILGLNGRLLGLTYNHQSNGRSGPLSRSWDRIMLNIGLEKDNFALMLRPWYRLDEDAGKDDNPDIKNYVGRGDLTAFYRRNDNEFSLLLRHSLRGGDDSRGAMQFDWAFPIAGKLRGYFQLFDGYGESLIDYNHRATYVGLGVSLMNRY